MRTIVTDTSTVIAVVLGEAARTEILRQTDGAALVAPESLLFEIPNAFSNKFKRDLLTLEEALQALEYFERIPIRYLPVDLRRATELAHEHNLYAYDAYMLATALRYACPLLSLDGGLNEAARQAGVEVLDIPE